MKDGEQTPRGRAPNRFERYPFLTASVLCALLLLALLAITEWIIAPGTEPADRPGATASLFQHRGLIVREWQPNRAHRFGTPPERKNGSREPVKDWYALDIDSMGFIEPSIIHPKPDLEIAFIGGSTTECLYMEPGERFPYLAGRLLEERTGLKVNALNAGKSGNTSMHSLVVYLGKVAPLKPRYAILLNAVNDIAVLNGHGAYWNGDRTFGLLRERERSLGRYGEDLRALTFPYTFALLSDGWKALKKAVRGWLSASAQDGGQAAALAGGGTADLAFGPPYEAALRSFARLARAWGSTPVLMTQVLVMPEGEGGHAGLLAREELERGNLDMPKLFRMQLYANSIIRHVAASEGAVLIDLAAAREWRNGEDVYDGLHFTAAGSRKVARIIAAALARHMQASPSN